MKFISIISLIVLMGSCKQATPRDTVACKKVETQLAVVKNVVDGKLVGGERFHAVDSLTKWTGIESQSPGDDVGQGSPTKEDYIKWSRWYETNKDNIYWDTKSRMILVRE